MSVSQKPNPKKKDQNIATKPLPLKAASEESSGSKAQELKAMTARVQLLKSALNQRQEQAELLKMTVTEAQLVQALEDQNAEDMMLKERIKMAKEIQQTVEKEHQAQLEHRRSAREKYKNLRKTESAMITAPLLYGRCTSSLFHAWLLLCVIVCDCMCLYAIILYFDIS